jgi:hypothetical protein
MCKAEPSVRLAHNEAAKIDARQQQRATDVTPQLEIASRLVVERRMKCEPRGRNGLGRCISLANRPVTTRIARQGVERVEPRVWIGQRAQIELALLVSPHAHAQQTNDVQSDRVPLYFFTQLEARDEFGRRGSSSCRRIRHCCPADCLYAVDSESMRLMMLGRRHESPAKIFEDFTA